jgi:hypothetical protein
MCVDEKCGSAARRLSSVTGPLIIRHADRSAGSRRDATQKDRKRCGAASERAKGAPAPWTQRAPAFTRVCFFIIAPTCLTVVSNHIETWYKATRAHAHVQDNKLNDD